MTHRIVATPEEAAALAVKAGCDLNCGDQYYALSRAVKKGLLPSQDVDQALRQILAARFRLGMFDPDAMVPYAQIPMSEVDSPAHAALALESGGGINRAAQERRRSAPRRRRISVWR